ncbi:MAG: hypothetical protein IH626_01750 [Rhodospirillales bacterium]|nr:hypothetical protein [Rhodospirillales bacterium]
MQALTVVAEWLRGHWAALAAIVFALAVITTIAFLPADIRKGALVTLAMILVGLAALLVWLAEPWAVPMDATAMRAAGVSGSAGLLFLAWAWMIW